MRSYLTFAVSIFFVLFNSGCATRYQPVTDASAASLTITGNTKHFFVDAFEDENCAASKQGQRVASFYGPMSNVENPELGVTLGFSSQKTSFLNFHYIDAQFALNRICDMSVAFSLEPRGKYHAHFFTNDDVTRCHVVLTEFKDGKELNVPSLRVLPHVCYGGENMGAINGKPQRLHWSVQVMPVTGK